MVLFFTLQIKVLRENQARDLTANGTSSSSLPTGQTELEVCVYIVHTFYGAVYQR